MLHISNIWGEVLENICISSNDEVVMTIEGNKNCLAADGAINQRLQRPGKLRVIAALCMNGHTVLPCTVTF